MNDNEKLQQFMQLLDEGIITQEEYDSRVAQIMPSNENEEVSRVVSEESANNEVVNAGFTRICPNCGTKGDVMFCPECGTKMIDEAEIAKERNAVKACPKCGYEGDYAFCPECGSQMVSRDLIQMNQASNAGRNHGETKFGEQVPLNHYSVEQEGFSETASKGKKRIAIIGGAAASAILIIVIIAILVGSGGKQTINFGEYSFKIPDEYVISSIDDDQSLYTVNTTRVQGLLLFDRLYDGTYTADSFKEHKLVALETFVDAMATDEIVAINDDGTFDDIDIAGNIVDGKADAFYDEDEGYMYIVIIMQEDNSTTNYMKALPGVMRSAKKISN